MEKEMHNIATLLRKIFILLWLIQLLSCSSDITTETKDTNQIISITKAKDQNLASIKSKTLNEQRFWDLIEGSMKKSGNDVDMAAVHLTRSLYDLSQDEIISFELMLTEKLIAADHFNVMIPLKIMFGSVTDDPYLYFRCWLIFQGKNIFESTLRTPDTLAGHVNIDIFPFAEPLLYVATNAYREVTGIKQENDYFPRNRTNEAGLNYNDGFITTKGKDWEESDLPKRAPRLWKMFNNE